MKRERHPRAKDTGSDFIVNLEHQLSFEQYGEFGQVNGRQKVFQVEEYKQISETEMRKESCT